jgi:hypothetical protein
MATCEHCSKGLVVPKEELLEHMHSHGIPDDKLEDFASYVYDNLHAFIDDKANDYKVGTDYDAYFEEYNKGKPTISTANGIARLYTVELEDEMGKWNDRYATKDGFYVLHEGKKHIVYKLEE